MAWHAQLKFVMTECSKTQIRLTGLSITSEKAVIVDLLCLHISMSNGCILVSCEPRQANLCLRAFRHDKF